MYNLMEHIVASATGGDSQKPIEEVLAMYSGFGYKQFELYAGGRGSSLDMKLGVSYYEELKKKYSITYSSLHTKAIEKDLGESFDYAVQCALFGEQLGVSVVVLNTTEKGHYAETMKRFLAATEGHDITPIIQIHEGRAIQSLEDVQEVLAEVQNPRAGVLLEVGSYHAMGVGYQKVIDIFGKKIYLVHVKDMIGAVNMPFGKGEIDLPGLFKAMKDIGYEGDYVVEMATKDRENTSGYIADAIQYIEKNCKG